MSEHPSAEPSTATAPGVERDAALAAQLAAGLAAHGSAYVPRTHHLVGGRPVYTNRLVLEASPYLLQHAHNPVDWRPWGEEAFAEARRLKRPIFLSVGYSTCHWCHVMEGESFEDVEIARVLNEQFICIKVDREERPDVDAIYMSAVQALTGQGGWPMSVFLTPDREPFYGGTYFPPRDGARGARIGFLSILQQLARTYADDSERIGRATASLVDAVKEQMEGAAAASTVTVPDRAPVELAVRTYARLFDNVHGGLRRAPKFPSNIPVRLVLRAHHRNPHPDLLHMATLTLQKMAGGGLYDQIGGGFHRYSVDAEWLVPHFEKMLYDNALLVVAYAEAFQVTAQPLFARVVRETLDYLMREMTAPEGGFYSATDADSEGEEGKFFVWSQAEIEALLGADAARFIAHYDVSPGGNFEGHNILNTKTIDETLHAALAPARQRLYDVRARRPPPLLDDKILAAWNGLAISAFATAGRVLGEPRYLAAAARAAEFLLKTMKPGDRMLRAYRAGAPLRPVGFLEDQAFVVQGLLDLWEATFEPRWLEAALALADAQERLYADSKAGGWFMTASDGEILIAREKPQYDGAEPSGTSVAWLNSLRLAALTDDPRWREVASRAYASVATVIGNNPLALSEGLLALDWMTAPAREIAIVVPAGTPPTDHPFGPVLAAFGPSRVVVAAPEGSPLASQLPLLRDRPAKDGLPTAYVCSAGHCDLPVTDPAALKAQLG